MAPMKRPSSTPAGAPSKKKAVDPITAKCDSIAAALRQADEGVIPATALEMLVPIIHQTLSVPKDKRHEFQLKSIDLLEKSLADIKTSLEATAEAKKATVEGALAERVARKEAAATAATAIADLQEKCKASEEAVKIAKEAAATAAKAMKDAEKALKQAATELQSSTKKKEELTKCVEAIEVYEKSVPDASTAETKASLKLLTKIGKQWEVEAALLDTAMKAFKKEVSARPEFDVLATGQFREFFAKKLTEVTADVEAKDAAMKTAEVATATTKEVKTTADEAVKVATAALASAKTAEKEGLAASKTAEQKVTSWLADMEVTLNESDDAADALSNFLEGPATAFAELKELPVPEEVPEEEAATAAPEADAEAEAAA